MQNNPQKRSGDRDDYESLGRNDLLRRDELLERFGPQALQSESLVLHHLQDLAIGSPANSGSLFLAAARVATAARQAMSFQRHAWQADLSLQPLLLYYEFVHWLKTALYALDPAYPQQTSSLQHGISVRRVKSKNYRWPSESIYVHREGILQSFLSLTETNLNLGLSKEALVPQVPSSFHPVSAAPSIISRDIMETFDESLQSKRKINTSPVKQENTIAQGQTFPSATVHNRPSSKTISSVNSWPIDSFHLPDRFAVGSLLGELPAMYPLIYAFYPDYAELFPLIGPVTTPQILDLMRINSKDFKPSRFLNPKTSISFELEYLPHLSQLTVQEVERKSHADTSVDYWVLVSRQIARKKKMTVQEWKTAFFQAARSDKNHQNLAKPWDESLGEPLNWLVLPLRTLQNHPFVLNRPQPPGELWLGSRPVTPLWVIHYVLLYTLSSLCRYQPLEWSDILLWQNEQDAPLVRAYLELINQPGMLHSVVWEVVGGLGHPT